MTMTMSSTICTIDTAEKDSERIQLIEKFIKSYGGEVCHEALKECSTRKESLDYLFEGEFINRHLDLAIEYKTLIDFSGTWHKLEDRLARAVLAHKDVALIIEYGTPILIDLEKYSCRFINSAVQDGSANILTLAILQAKCAEWERDGVHVRIISNKSLFTTTVLNLLYFVSKEIHGGLALATPDHRSQLITWLAKCPVRGVGLKVAEKLVDRFFNMHSIASQHEDSLVDCVGKIGYNIERFFYDSSLRQKAIAEKIPDLDKELIKPVLESQQILPKDTTIKNNIKVTPSKETSLKSPLNQSLPKSDGMEYLTNYVSTYKEPIKPLTLEEKIIHEVQTIGYPYGDQECLRFIMQEEGNGMAFAHATMRELLSKSHQLHMSQGIITFCGVKADDILDIGV